MALLSHLAGSSDRQQSPILSSNNPFRNRTTSPTNSIAQSPVTAAFNLPNTAPERPTSRNPFLDQSEKKDDTVVNVRPTSPLRESTSMATRMSPSKPLMTGHTAELFVCDTPPQDCATLTNCQDNLNLNDKPHTNGSSERPGVPPSFSNGPRIQPRSENVPPRAGLSGHHTSRSGEERYRHGAKPRRPNEELDIFADPPTGDKARPRPSRRNSDSSLASRMLSPEEERRRKEKHRREREERHKDGRRGPPNSSRSKKPNQRLDIIDSLDVTSIYGKGLFHHDGPFDACNPARNRKGSRRPAPMEAFAKDSANNALGGSGPVHKDINFDQFHGRTEQGFADYATSGSSNPAAQPVSFATYAGAHVTPGAGAHAGVDRANGFNPVEVIPVVHGDESLGLGTSTFLEGTPAAKAAIQRHETDDRGADGGLGRKRSLAQRIRGISNAKSKPYHGRMTSPEGRPHLTSGESQSAGGMPRINETKPFFEGYDERKGRSITIAEDRNRRSSFEGGAEDNITVGSRTGAAENGRSRALSSPKRAAPPAQLERRVTDAANGNGKEETSGSGSGGFLSRVKSLKGGKKGKA
ncbi:uncharacterized protein KY384_000881 [Bacidia gigantensis]|uniref:uncharacterized protein n=1 Tax=Bacidia gigantensis TaxID=2732470 RepID=UPI001D037A68|nr:uncharacterized protein KY384_000881 [Bacidia gigantensis]KAG8534038.1 hypothetical protein KY384_000881 [Bacidia gigantensis]